MLTHLLEAAILGLVQGLAEFLPVSSTAHLVLLQKAFGLDQETYGLSFDMFTNVGTQIALIAFFWKDIVSIFRSIRLPRPGVPLSAAEKVPWWIAGVTVIVGIAGLLLEESIATQFRSLEIIAAMLVTFGFVMLAAEKISTLRKRPAELTAGKAYGIGLAQILAFVPGVSRSGASISAGLFAGLTREAAARYSFLLSIPVTTAAILKRMATATADFASNGLPADVAAFYLVGAVVAGVSGYYALRFLISYVSRSSLAVFAYYRFALAAAIVAYLLLG